MYLFLATATTGLNPEYDDIIKLSYRIEHNNAIVDQNTFHVKPRRGRLPSSISQEALDFNGLDIDTLRTYGNPEEACYNFIATLKEVTNKGKDKLTVVGHNIKFDLDFLNNFIKLYTDYNLYSYVKFGGYDLLYVAPLIENSTRESYRDYKFATLCKVFGLYYDSKNIESKTENIKNLFDVFNKIVGYNSSAGDFS